MVGLFSDLLEGFLMLLLQPEHSINTILQAIGLFELDLEVVAH